MKNIVILDSLKEKELRNNKIFSHYFKIIKKDISHFFVDDQSFEHVFCPACQYQGYDDEFSKFGFEYKKCQKCASLFVNPRPPVSELNDYYQKGKAIQYWKNIFVKKSKKNRKNIIYDPYAEWIHHSIRYFGLENHCMVDLNSKYEGFLKAVSKKTGFMRKIMINPLFDYGLLIKNLGFEKLCIQGLNDPQLTDIQADAVILIEAIECAPDVSFLIQLASSVIKPGGLMFIITSSYSGFDVQMLKEKSNKIYPPDHLNLLSLRGIKTLMHRFDFEIVELSTPGRLDVDIVKNAIKNDPFLELPSFVKMMFKEKDSETLEDFQNFLQRNLISSHLRLIARKEPHSI